MTYLANISDQKVIFRIALIGILATVFYLQARAPYAHAEVGDYELSLRGLASSSHSLHGHWRVKLDPQDVGVTQRWASATNTSDWMTFLVPGTLDDAHLGKKSQLKPLLNTEILTNLKRKYNYVGAAWYQKEIEIPKDWQGKKITFRIERALWHTEVFLNGISVGQDESLSTAHEFDLSQYAMPGKHLLTVKMDNRDRYPNINKPGEKYVGDDRGMAHAYTNHTQIKWNGMLGDVSLNINQQVQAPKLVVYPDTKERSLRVLVPIGALDNTNSIAYRIADTEGNLLLKGKAALNKIAKDTTETRGPYKEFILTQLDQLTLWDEFNPVVYRLTVSSPKKDSDNNKPELTSTFGYRTLIADKGEFLLNGKRIFLRGNLDVAAFPLTGYPPMDKGFWLKLFAKAKSYGLNHIRYHSWCPPEAAFSAADELGLYLQIELPHWSGTFGKDDKTTEFLRKEAERILKDYGNHPSFMLFSLGNELEGDTAKLNELVDHLKQFDSRPLYATTTFSFQRDLGKKPAVQDQFFITQKTDKDWVRGQGIFDTEFPRFDRDYRNGSLHINVPIVSHEIGQYAVFPNLNEIRKYRGNLQPLNFIAIKNEYVRQNRLAETDNFLKASGALAALLYKEEIERALKTPGFDGFQLLQLQDFPGQGTALVGLLDTFWDSKGIISPDEFREFNSELVPLLRFKKAVYEYGEILEANIEIANYWKDLSSQSVTWRILDDEASTIAIQTIAVKEIKSGLNTLVGSLAFKPNGDLARQYSVEVSLDNTRYSNKWPIWFYPKQVDIDSDTVVITPDIDVALGQLQKGRSVLLNPRLADIKGIEGKFVPVFWSPVHFPNQPGSMGLLIKDEHPSFAHFPTDFHTNWQWWDLAKNSKSVEIGTYSVTPLVQVIDNFVKNRRLASVFEVRVGKGKLVYSAMDISEQLETRPVARQLKHSLINYMESDDFEPTTSISANELKAILK